MALLDPSIIARGIEPVQIPDPMISMENALKVQQLRQQNATFPLRQQDLQSQVEERRATTQRINGQNQDLQRDREDDKAYQQAMLEAGPDPDKIDAAATKITNPTVQAKLLDTASKQRARNATITAKQHDEFAKVSVGAASDLQAVDDAKDNAPLQLGLWAQFVKKMSGTKDENGNPLIPPGSLDPTTVPDTKTIKILQTVADKTNQWHAGQAKLMDESDKAVKAKETERVKETNDLHAEADTTFQGVQTVTPAAIADFASQNDAHAAYAKRWLQPLVNSPNAADIIHKRALTAVQRDTTATTQQQRDEQANRDDEIARHNRAQELNEAARAVREHGQTANSIAVDRRKTQTDLNKAKEEEEQLATLRSNLENAINSGGKSYVTEKGVTVAMKKATGDEQDTAENLTQRMRTAYQDATNKLKRVVADKNVFGQALGMGVTVPTEAIHSSLDADLRRVQRKSTTMANVKEFATSKFKGDIAAAKAAIKAQGYSITDER